MIVLSLTITATARRFGCPIKHPPTHLRRGAQPRPPCCHRLWELA